MQTCCFNSIDGLRCGPSTFCTAPTCAFFLALAAFQRCVSSVKPPGFTDSSHSFVSCFRQRRHSSVHANFSLSVLPFFSAHWNHLYHAFSPFKHNGFWHRGMSVPSCIIYPAGLSALPANRTAPCAHSHHSVLPSAVVLPTTLIVLCCISHPFCRCVPNHLEQPTLHLSCVHPSRMSSHTPISSRWNQSGPDTAHTSVCTSCPICSSTSA